MNSAFAPPPSRRVRHLRIRSPAQEEARRAAIVLADALHTASMPAAERGQMLLVRKLALGRISPSASAATLALLVERALREMRMAAVPFDLPGATDANAVLIPGRAEAITRLGRLHARGIEAREWFWAAAVPSWKAGLSRGERWLVLLEAAHELPEAVLVAAEVVREAVCANMEDELLQAVSLGRALHWLRAEGWNRTTAADARPAESLLAARHAKIVQRWQHRGAPEEALTWIVLMLAVAERPARAADARLAVRAAAWLAFSPARAEIAPRLEDMARDAPDHAANNSEPGEPSLEPAIANTAFVRPDAVKTSERASALEVNEGGELAEAPATSAEDELTPDSSSGTDRAAALFGEHTHFAGLLFLLPVLERLSFAEFLEVHPSLLESHFPARLLLLIGARIGMKPHDPMSIALGDMESFAFEELRGLPEPARVLLAAPVPRVRIDTPQIAWLTALRRWCRRYAGVGLVSLVRRPGRVSTSLTHLEIRFDLAAADLRVRRAALDIDPGWVQWLGRVVSFHYLEPHERTA